MDVGAARSPGITYQQLLDTDTHPVPASLRAESPVFLGDADVPNEHYISRDFYDREARELWRRVWQFACREEHIPNPGDYIVYEICRDSYLVVRQPDGSIKSYVNACLHRGRLLKTYDGRCSELVCPFHGFAWTLGGDLRRVPAEWDFPHVEQRSDEFNLPEAKVGTWAGFVFINPDPDCESLESFLGVLPEHFERWDMGARYVQTHVGKIIHANWKIAQEAFCEAYHVNATHPQTMRYLGDTNSQIDIWGNVSRVITPGGISSPLLEAITEVDILRAMMDIRVDEPTPLPIPEGSTARAVAADSSRNRWRPMAGDIVDQWSDAEFVDNLDYTLFPNFHPWGAFNRITYRFRPWEDDHRKALMEVFFLSPFTGERPPPAAMQLLQADEPWTNAPDLGLLAKVFEQDVFNMARVQQGLETTRKPGVTLGNYQESKVRHLHTVLREWVK